MRKMEENYGGSRASWFLGLFSCVSLMLYLIGGLALIANLIGFCYPAFASFKVGRQSLLRCAGHMPLPPLLRDSVHHKLDECDCECRSAPINALHLTFVALSPDACVCGCFSGAPLIGGGGWGGRAMSQAIDSPDALASQQLLSYWAIFGAFFTMETSFR